MIGQRREQLAAQIVEVEVAPARALRNPYESFAVFQELYRRRVLGPARRPLFAHDDAAFAGLRIAGGKLHDVLPPIGSVAEQFAPVGRPRNVIDVMADDGIVERLSVADVYTKGLLRIEVINEQV